MQTEIININTQGDGIGFFNGKKVLQLSYQFTNNNNTVRGNDLYTPMFDILRGPLSDSYEDSMTMQNKVDDVMHSLAEKIKSYKEPLLFRLNNEMNSDWVSYCGQVTLMDPDIFSLTWERMAKILIISLFHKRNA